MKMFEIYMGFCFFSVCCSFTEKLNNQLFRPQIFRIERCENDELGLRVRSEETLRDDVQTTFWWVSLLALLVGILFVE
jgi:hypothetical protein